MHKMDRERETRTIFKSVDGHTERPQPAGFRSCGEFAAPRTERNWSVALKATLRAKLINCNIHFMNISY